MVEPVYRHDAGRPARSDLLLAGRTAEGLDEMGESAADIARGACATAVIGPQPSVRLGDVGGADGEGDGPAAAASPRPTAEKRNHQLIGPVPFSDLVPLAQGRLAVLHLLYRLNISQAASPMVANCRLVCPLAG